MDIQNIQGTVPVLHHVHLQIHAGQIHALVGPSGSGKSTLSALISGAVAKDQYIIRSGHIWWMQEGQAIDLIDLDWFERRQLMEGRIEVIFQEPATTLDPVVKLGSQLVESGVGFLSAEEVKDQMNRLGLDAEHIWDQYPWQLSGGQQQRCLLARVMASGPALIMADEPTSALDKHREGQFLKDLVQVIKADLAPALLLISHDLHAVGRLADQISVMYGGRMIEQGEASGILSHPKHALTRSMRPKDSSAQGETKNDHDDQILLEVKGLRAGYHPGAAVVEHASLRIHRGELIGIAGPSGSGKSSFFRTLLDLMPWRSGEVFAEGTLQPRMQMVYQDPGRTLNPMMTMGQIMEEWRRVHGTHADDVEGLLQEVGLEMDMLHRMPHMFSGGQKQRFAIARALLVQPDILLADEPFSSLDAHLQDQIMELLQRLAKTRRIGILVVAHDLRKLEQYCDRLLLFDEGEIFWEGNPEELRQSADPRIDQLRMYAPELPN